jgi:predicted O-methyltransferase YrrM
MDKFKKYRKILKKVLFIGGDANLASTRVRTVQIAKFLGCDFTTNSYLDNDLLKDKEIFILNKAFGVDISSLKARGKVIIDIIDDFGIPENADGYIFSSQFAQNNVRVKEPSFVFYQHHLNFSNEFNPYVDDPKRISFIGEKFWYPQGLLSDHTAYLEMYGDIEEKEKEITDAYRNTDILLNFRNLNMNPEKIKRHLILNSGMKMINAIGFGIPSISPDEPAFKDIGGGCTIFAPMERCEEALRLLKNDKNLYLQLKEECHRRAKRFSIDQSANDFISLFIYFDELEKEFSFPLIMRRQEEPFNGDFFVREEFLKLKKKFNIKKVIETGTCLGTSTLWFAKNFDSVETIEIKSEFRDCAIQRWEGKKNIKSYLGDSSKILPKLLKKVDNKTIIFLDAHFEEETFPLKKELESIKKAKIKPVIVVHDFVVPGEYLFFDTWQGEKLSIDLIKKYLDDIYGSKGYKYHYNSLAKSSGARRGVIYIYPKAHK